MKMSDVTSLGRLPDPRYPTNRTIMALSLAVGAAGAIFQWLGGTALLDGVNWAIGAGFAVCSLLLSQNIPARPVAGNEVKWGHAGADA